MPAGGTGNGHVSVRRARLGENAFGLVETVQVTGARRGTTTSDGYSPHYQICLPYRGAFSWHVGNDHVLADPNAVLFVTGGEEFAVSQPIDGGYAELIVTLEPELLAELTAVPVTRLMQHPLFRRRSHPASTGVQRRGMEVLHHVPGCDGLEAEEILLRFLQASLGCRPAPREASPSTRRLIGRAKTFLAAHLSAPVTLAQVARAAGTSATYLTTVFREVEGQPLHRYLVQLRLARALAELPQASDIASLATELGFAHHSHFTAAFRRAFGCTPSAFREATARERRAHRDRRTVRPL